MQQATESDRHEYGEEEKVQVGVVASQESAEETKEQTLKQLLHISDYHSNDIFDVVPFYPSQTLHPERGGGELLSSSPTVHPRKRDLRTAEGHGGDQGGRIQSGRREKAARRDRKTDQERSNARKSRQRRAEQNDGLDSVESSREAHASGNARSESRLGSSDQREHSPVQVRGSYGDSGAEAVTAMRSRNAFPTVKPSKAVRNYRTPQGRAVFQSVQLRTAPGHQVRLQTHGRPERSSMGDTQRPAVSAKTKHSQAQAQQRALTKIAPHEINIVGSYQELGDQSLGDESYLDKDKEAEVVIEKTRPPKSSLSKIQSFQRTDDVRAEYIVNRQ